MSKFGVDDLERDLGVDMVLTEKGPSAQPRWKQLAINILLGS